VRTYTIDVVGGAAPAQTVATAAAAPAAMPAAGMSAAGMSAAGVPAAGEPAAGEPAAADAAAIAAGGAAAVSAASDSTAASGAVASNDGDADGRQAAGRETRLADPTRIKRPSGAGRTVPVLEAAASAPISARRGQSGWAVQIGSFANSENAQRMMDSLRSEGFPVYMMSSGEGPARRHRIRVGPLADREAADQAAARLKAQGHRTSVIQPPA
jgi:DedD protein